MLDDVRGQDRSLPFLRRFAECRIGNPLLLIGDEGTGRRFAAIQAVKEVFCTGTKASGCPCLACEQIDQNAHFDLRFIAATPDKDLGIDAMRDVVEESKSYPSTAPLRVFVIDGVDRMTTPAANALLKTLEEPPPTSRFILIAEELSRIIPTIRSRCGKVPFGPLSESVLLAELSKFERDGTKALVYVRMADGSLGRALQYWGSGSIRVRDQAMSFLDHGLKGDVSSLFSSVDGVSKELPLTLRFLEQVLCDTLMISHDPSRIVNVDAADRLHAFASNPALVRALPRLLLGTRVVRDRARAARINMPFHTKTFLVESFSGI